MKYHEPVQASVRVRLVRSRWSLSQQWLVPGKKRLGNIDCAPKIVSCAIVEDNSVAESHGVTLLEGRWCFGKTPMQTFLDALPLAKEKLMAACGKPLAMKALALLLYGMG